jgi:hypothetical protein
MRKLIWSLLLTLGSATAAKAQVTMTLQVPPAGVLLKNQLWNMLLVNSTAQPLTVRVNMVLVDERDNQVVLTASTAPISLPRGARQLQAKDLGPIQYAYGNPAYHVDGNPNGLLPAGSFQACYTLVNAYKEATFAENCLQVNIDPLSPPLLNTPSDEGRIYSFYPQFTWLPPTPPALFNDLSYALVLVKMLPGQAKGDAIQDNVPVYAGTFLKNLYLNYPSSYPALDTNSTYAWRVVALNAGKPQAMSDIWTFRVAAPVLLARKPQDDTYIALQRGQSPSIASCTGSILLSYDNRTADTAVRYTITSLQETGNPVIQQGLVLLRYGQNLIKLPLQGGFGMRKIYLFQLLNSRGETWTLKFTRTSNP